ncbi:MAG TPA: DUF1540 domain-containing protein [Nitrospiraceae bacterium]|jgi:hypothetical protein|nr:DUF1540 domain-containing protein [Nitrospiraceae bacterium]
MAVMMPKVLDCEVAGCSYNKNKACHAMAITVGSMRHPQCDTYLNATQQGGVPDTTGGVGACKEDDCRFNRSLECTASGIHVGIHMDHADCKTFAQR